MDVSNANKFWFRTKLATAAMLLSAAVLAFAVSSGFITPCNRALGQSTSCSVGDAETFTGPTVYSDSIQLSDEFLVGATPAAGTSGQVLVSQGSSAAPEWAASSTLGVPVFVHKTADETDNNAPLQNDDHLFFSVDANSEYAAKMLLRTTQLTGTEQVVYDFNQPAAATWDCGEHWVNTSSTSSGITHITETTGGGPLLNVTIMQLDCLIVTAGTSGTFQFQWYGTGTSGYTIEKGSWLEYTKLN